MTRTSSTGAEQTLAYNTFGTVETLTDGADTTSLRYDAAGNRLMRIDSTGKTLYLPGGTELRLDNGSSTVVGTRYYRHRGSVVAIRTGNSLTWQVADHHGTGQFAIDASTLTIQRRRSMPFGETRGTPPTSWVGDKGYVGGTQDPTGLTHPPRHGRFKIGDLWGGRLVVGVPGCGGGVALVD